MSGRLRAGAALLALCALCACPAATTTTQVPRRETALILI
jgi:hypothetical protein